MITLRDKLPHLSYPESCKLLGAHGKDLILQGGKYNIDLFEQTGINDDDFELNLGEAVVNMTLQDVRQT